MTIQANFPAIKPSLLLDFANTKQLDSRITYTRASTATFYNGVTTAMAEQNLLTYSQDFSNAAWSKTNLTVTADSIAAPDGTTTADTITSSAGTNAKFIGEAVTMTSGLAYVTSFYAKTNTQQFIQIIWSGSNVDYANFDLVNGTVGTVSGTGLTATITSVGNSWYRCVAVHNTLSVSSVSVNVVAIDSSTSTRAASTSTTNSFYLWGAQVEQRSAVTAYTATTTQAITNYIPVLQTAASGVARFDNNPTTGESLGLLIEESRTNLLTYSAQFDNGYWGKQNSTITADTIVAPDGTLSGDRLFEDTATSGHSIAANVTVTSGVSYTQSIYAKAGERPRLVMYEYSSTGAAATFDLTTGTVVATSGGGSPSATITSVGNGWYRCTMTWTTGSTNAGLSFRLQTAGATGATTYTGNGYSGLFLWGAQMELGAFATSYIPTVASQVTRAADAASMTGTNFSSWFNAGEGTLYADASLKTLAGGIAVINDGANSFANMIELFEFSPSNSYGFRVFANSSAQISYAISDPALNTFVKFIGGYKVNDFAGTSNGATVTTDSIGILPIPLTTLRLGVGWAGTYTNGTIKKFAYYPIRLSNTNLVALTS
jgi:hypothetical protein